MCIRDSPSSAADILILNDQERGFTPEDSEDVKWNYLSGAMHTHKILTGGVSGIDTLENGNIICAVDYEGVRILVPGREMFMDTWPEDSLPSIRYQVRLRRCLGATIDFMLSGIDFTHRAAVGSRREALKQRQARYYLSLIHICFWLFDHSMPLRASSAGSEMILSSSWGKTA